MAGLGEHTDFLTQVHIAADEEHDEAARPDAVVQLPGGGAIPIDAKVPLDAFMDALAAEAPAAQAEALNRHVELVRGKVRELSAKGYWRRFDRSPEMVVMFVASEAAFAAAMERYPRLLDEAAQARVVVTTPMTMLGLLQVVALGWREAALSENAEQVRTLAQTLVSRLGVMSRHLSEVGKGLERAARAHNDAVGSYESRLLTTARQFTRLGVDADGLKEPARANTSIRQLVGEPERPTSLAGTSPQPEAANGASEPRDPQALAPSGGGQSIHTSADAEGPQHAEQTLWCQPGAHGWQRPAQRGRPPTSCPIHAPERVARPATANSR